MSAREYQLPLLREIEKRLQEKKMLVQIIQGPRQVGKTTLLKQLCQYSKYNGFHYVSADMVTTPLWIHEQWQRARENQAVLIIDEVQKIPDWSESVKKLWDDDQLRGRKPIKCILSGSSSLNLQKGLRESLTGRFESLAVHQWDYLQSQKIKKMSLDEYLLYGGYPGSYPYIKETGRWVDYLTNSIVETVISRDILMQAQIKAPALFRQCFYLVSSYPAQMISYNKLLGQLQDRGNIDLVKHYLDLLEKAFLIKLIFKYSQNEIRKKTSSPKIILMAPALSTFHRFDNLDSNAKGRLFESAVGAELVKKNLKPTYWAEGDYEVDFVVAIKNRIIAIEVKSGRSKKAKSLEVFLQKNKTAQFVFITKENFSTFIKNPSEFLLENALAL